MCEKCVKKLKAAKCFDSAVPNPNGIVVSPSPELLKMYAEARMWKGKFLVQLLNEAERHVDVTEPPEPVVVPVDEQVEDELDVDINASVFASPSRKQTTRSYRS